MKNYLKEFEEALDAVVAPALGSDDGVQEVNSNYEVTPQQRKLANLGTVLMDLAKTAKDDNLSNVMAKVGNELTNFGTPFGPKSLEDLMAKTGASKAIISKLLDHAQAVADHKTSLANDHEDGGLDDTDDNEFAEPNDDEIARQADAAARAKR